jgi:hypothetical protein
VTWQFSQREQFVFRYGSNSTQQVPTYLLAMFKIELLNEIICYSVNKGTHFLNKDFFKVFFCVQACRNRVRQSNFTTIPNEKEGKCTRCYSERYIFHTLWYIYDVVTIKRNFSIRSHAISVFSFQSVWETRTDEWISYCYIEIDKKAFSFSVLHTYKQQPIVAYYLLTSALDWVISAAPR